ncbi:DUF2125 domain-containing protein [Roseovarius aestuariivivens]|uniref:DUF2125 domain-containing protein n=1 Tax=Roseovarius aestuariivivens TaxID=1888910 RepID=UPI0010815EDD|nr:DUF2125 domain-containing protein [Roseovarius aestuariivivens]
MRKLLILILVVAGAWAGYWAVGSASVQTTFQRWFEERRAEGWVAEYGELTTRGFPNRFDTTISNVSLADPATGLAWDAPFFQIFALSYRPNHIIAVWPNDQRLATPLQKFDIASEDMRASLVTQASPRLPLERLTLTATTLAVTEDGKSQPTRAQSLTLAAERLAGAEASYRLGLNAEGLAPALDWRARLDPGGTLPDAFEAFRADMTVQFDTPWDLDAIEEARPQPRQIRLRLAEARWGRLELQAAGELDVDTAGRPTGEIVVKARNWREILGLAVSSGALPQGLADTLEDGLSLIAGLAGNPRTLDIPLTFAGDRIRLGPVPIGPAPRLILR